MDFDLSKINFDKCQLIPVIVQEENGSVLMLAYMNKEALIKTLDTKIAWYYSRSRKELWQKGKTSGNFQKVLSIQHDCDGDTLLMKVKQMGHACHTGTYTCFDNRILANFENKEITVPKHNALSNVLNDLYILIEDRQHSPIHGSYTNYLFDKGIDKILKKVGEEAVETILASKNNVKTDIVYEMSDLWYHCLVLLAYHNIMPNELFKELIKRRNQSTSYHKFNGKTGIRPEF